MIRIIFLLLIVMSATVFAQTAETPKAVKFDEFEAQAPGAIDARMSGFFTELDKTPTLRGVIINYGTEREIRRREKQVLVSFEWRKFDAARLTMVNGGFNAIVKSELWIVPPGAENPSPASNARLFDEFGKFTDEYLWHRVDSLYFELNNNPSLQAYMVISGSPKQFADSENRFKRQIALKKFDASKLVIKNGGQAGELKIQIWLVTAAQKSPKTEVYIVPPGAKPPTR